MTTNHVDNLYEPTESELLGHVPCSENEACDRVTKILEVNQIAWDDETNGYTYWDDHGMEQVVARSLWELHYTIYQEAIGKAIL